MKQQRFESQHAAQWDEITQICAGKGDAIRLPALYRSLCQNLALARQRGYSPSLTDHLHTLVQLAHAKLYGATPVRALTLRDWLLYLFPQRVRSEWRLLLVSLAAFWLVGAAVGLYVWLHPSSAYSWMRPEDLDQFVEMYSSSAKHLGRRDNQDDVLMFGFYIWNNVSICFRTFAAGLLGGLPAVLSVISNGMHGGVVAAWLTLNPTTKLNFWSFVVTHSSFEITGLNLAGVAGMRLGLAVIHPGRRSRRRALLETGQYVLPILLGAATLTATAAFFEAFWSSSSVIPASVKFTVGGLCWASVIGYLGFAGRQHAR